MDSKEAIILKVARSVRRLILSWNCGSSEGMCGLACGEIQDRLEELGIKVKIKDGLFRIDKFPTSDEEAHTWIEWKGKPLDVTADQFNGKLYPKNRVKAIVFNSHRDRFRTWEDRKIYK